ncbi:MAG: aspartate 1-decarboxylase, partial [Planctomycetota bacterium]
MLRDVLYCKIHMAKVTAAHPDYVGSITIDRDLLEATGLRHMDLAVQHVAQHAPSP